MYVLNQKQENYINLCKPQFFYIILGCTFHGHVFLMVNNLDPVVQSIVSLTISLRHKFVKQISAKVTNTLLFFVEKM